MTGRGRAPTGPAAGMEARGTGRNAQVPAAASRRVDPDRLLRDAATLLGERSRRGLSYEPEFRTLPSREAAATAAVDGSHAVLVDNGAVWVVAVRAAAVSWPGRPAGEQPVMVHASVPDEAREDLRMRYGQRGLAGPAHVRSAEAYAEGLRALAEATAARLALPDLPSGSLLLLDGALHGLPPDADVLVRPVLERAGEQGVHVVGVAKRSRLHAAGVPIVPAVHRRGAARADAWSSPVPDLPHVHVARLHPRAPFSYRVDGTDEALAMLPPLCRDAVYLGYPYPLALAHNAVALTAAHVEETRHRLRDAVRDAGGAEALALLEDPHAMLDLNVPG